MKKGLFTLIFLLGAISSLMAQDTRARSSLKLRLMDNRPLRVAIDGRFFRRADNSLTIVNIPPGRHSIKVFSIDNRMGRRMIPVFNGSIRISPYSANTMIVDPYRHSFRIRSRMIDPRGYTTDDRSRSQGYQDDRGLQDHNRQNDGYNGGYNNNSYDNRDLSMDYSQGQDQMDEDGDYNDDRDNGGQVIIKDRNDDNYTDNNQYDDRANDDRRGSYNDEPLKNYSDQLMRQNEIDDLQLRVKAKITDSDKLKLMKAALDHRIFTTAQVKPMLHWLNFDNSRLDFAKWAVVNVTDKNNYWKLESEFSFDGSKDEFTRFIRDNKY